MRCDVGEERPVESRRSGYEIDRINNGNCEISQLLPMNDFSLSDAIIKLCVAVGS